MFDRRNGVKTTSLKTIIGLLEQRSYSIEYDGEFLTSQPPYKRARNGIGYVSKDVTLFHELLSVKI